MAARELSKVNARIAFAYPNFTLLQLSRFLIILAMEAQSVAVGWQVYEITKQPLALGLAGLAQFLPGILLFLVAGTRRIATTAASCWFSATWASPPVSLYFSISLFAAGIRCGPSTRRSFSWASFGPSM